jgi:hypothetical protein
MRRGNRHGLTDQRQIEMNASPPVEYVVVTQSSNQFSGMLRKRPTERIAPAPPCMEKVCVGTRGCPHFPRDPLNSTSAAQRPAVVVSIDGRHLLTSLLKSLLAPHF